MPPPPASDVASRLFLGPALRAQPDRRLVKLVRDGYENAFDEIVRRYGKPLGRYAAAIVSPNRAEDVTQDAFSKALLALRGTDKEIELRPWLYRIVRNTALNDIRDQPPPAAELHEGIDGVETPVEAAERRAEMADLLERLRALPDPQRAAIVMRELEGLSHEEIASALGMSGGGARQAIYRARRTLRDGAGMLLPLPLLQYLLAGGGAAAGAGLAGAGGAGLAAGAGGAGAGTALKAGLATFLVAGSVAGGVALHDANHQMGSTVEAAGAAQPDQSGGPTVTPPLTEVNDTSGSGERGDDDHGGSGPGHRGEREPGDDHGGGNRGPGSANSGSGGGGSHSGRGSGSSGHEGGESGDDGGGGGSGHSGSGSSGGGSGSGEIESGSGGSDDSVDDLSGGDSGSGSSSGSSGSSSGSGSSGDD